jgi:predicted dehydrogenase
MTQTSLSRRHFLLSATAAGVSCLALRAEDRKPSSDKLRVGAIGIAGQGFGDLREIAAGGAEIIALCDVDTKRKQVVEQIKHFDKAKFYTDYRKMIDAGGLDAVMVATPDHTHAPATMYALKAGLHAFCEKPLTHTVTEARALAAEAKKRKLVTQMGTQIHAGDNYRRVVEQIRAGAIGDVKEVHCWVGRPWDGADAPKAEKVPDGLEWDLWLGPAKPRDYSSGYFSMNWRRYWDFGGGTLNDMFCHHVDLPFWALGLRHPTHVETEGPKVHPYGAPKWLIVRYDFPAKDKRPALKLTWYDGGKRPKHFEEKGLLPKWGDGTLFIGTKGMLLADYGNHRLLGDKVEKAEIKKEDQIPSSVGHYKEWVQACKSGGSTTCNFDYSGALTESALLGTVSYRLGKSFDWAGEKMKASESGAEKYLRKEYRKGFEVEASEPRTQ